MSSDNLDMIDPKELIEYEEPIVRFRARSAAGQTEDQDETIMLICQPGSFKHGNEAGQLRSVASLEDACIEGQRAALCVKRFLADS